MSEKLKCIDNLESTANKMALSRKRTETETGYKYNCNISEGAEKAIQERFQKLYDICEAKGVKEKTLERILYKAYPVENKNTIQDEIEISTVTEEPEIENIESIPGSENEVDYSEAGKFIEPREILSQEQINELLSSTGASGEEIEEADAAIFEVSDKNESEPEKIEIKKEEYDYETAFDRIHPEVESTEEQSTSDQVSELTAEPDYEAIFDAITPNIDSDEVKSENKFSIPEKVWYGFGAAMTNLRAKIDNLVKPTRKEEETDLQYEKRARNGKIAIGIGAIAVAICGYELIQLLDASHTANAISANIDPSTAVPSGPEFSTAAQTVVPGEGWYQTFKDMGIPSDEWSNLLHKVGPQLQSSGAAYQIGDGFGISNPGQLPKSVLELIQNSR